MRTKKMRAVAWMVGMIIIGILLMLLFIGTRKGERKAKLSSHDLSALTEIEAETTVISTAITNVRTLYVVSEDEILTTNNSARYFCGIARKNDALVEQVRVVKIDQTKNTRNGKPTFVLIGECDCTALRIR